MTDPHAEEIAAEGSAHARSPQAGQNGNDPAAARMLRFDPAPDHQISVKTWQARNMPGNQSGKRLQPMRGYEDEYVDIVDWIIRITDRIWEDQAVGYIYDTYRTACRVY